LIFTGEIMVRRWSYKAIAHIGRKADIKTLTERMRTEPDPENLTWIMSAIFSLQADLPFVAGFAGELSGQTKTVDEFVDPAANDAVIGVV
jgi:hypothetical protein